MVTKSDLGLADGRTVHVYDTGAGDRAVAALPGRRPRLGPRRRCGRPGVAPGPRRLAGRAAKYGREENTCKLGPLPALRRAAGQAARSWPGQAAE
jgi:hypothetical protein